MRLSDFSSAEVAERIVYMDARARLHMAHWLAFVAEFDSRKLSHRRGFRSTAEWLSVQCRIEARTARDHVRVANWLQDKPSIETAFGEGRLSYCQVRALSRASDLEDESALLKVALVSTVRQLEQHVRQLRRATSADLDVANQGRAKRYLRHVWEQDGSLKFFGRLAADDGAAFVETIESKAAFIYGENGDPCCADGLRAPRSAPDGRTR